MCAYDRSGQNLLIDDFEDEDLDLPEQEGRLGQWYSYEEVAGDHQLANGELDAPRLESYWAAHTSGKRSRIVGGFWCSVERLRVRQHPIRRFALLIRGTSNPINVALLTPGVVPFSNGGTCTEEDEGGCWDAYRQEVEVSEQWREFFLPFSEFEQGGYGQDAGPLDLTRIRTIEFQSDAGVFEYWVDDLSFYIEEVYTELPDDTGSTASDSTASDSTTDVTRRRATRGVCRRRRRTRRTSGRAKPKTRRQSRTGGRMMASRMRMFAAVWVIPLLAACGTSPTTKDPEPATTDQTGEPSDAAAPSTSVGECETPTPGAAPLRRLSNFEYENSVADLTGSPELAKKVSATLVREPTSLGFRNSASALTIPPLLAEKYVQAALDVAHDAIDLPGWFPCALDAADQACIQTFVEDFGKRAYRRPLTREELVRFSELYAKSITEEGDYRKAVEWVVATMLSSSNFLFRVELDGDASAVHQLSPYEMAQRLSYLLWQTMPDDELFRAAEAGELATDEGLEAQTRRMLKDERAFRVYEFFEQWLNVDELLSVTRDPESYPEYRPALQERLGLESRMFVNHLLANGGTLEELFTADYTFADTTLAAHYGLAPVDAAAGFAQVEAPGRSGILTQAGLLIHDHAKSSSMVRRGLKVRTDWLCQTVNAPPADVDVSPPVLDGTLTQRQRLEAHRTEPSCEGCHMLMDPVGAIFDGFDALGRARTMDEAGAAIEVGGDLIGTRDIDGHYDSVGALGKALANSEQVRDCVVQQSFRFFFGRELESADTCSKAQIKQGFARRGYKLEDLIMSLMRSDQFRYRKPVPDTETP